MKRKILLRALCAAATLPLILCGCGKQKTTPGRFDSSPDYIPHPDPQTVGDAYPDKTVGFQLEEPAAGEEIAVLVTSMGEIYIRLFPEAAPKAVENFKGLINKGAYNGIIFHRVIEGFMIQGGDTENQDGTGGKSIWEDDFEDEFDKKLLNLRGSLAMANSGVNTNGSQFFINQATADDFDRENFNYDETYKNAKESYDTYKRQNPQILGQYPTLASFIEANGGIYPLEYAVPEEVWELYGRTGGNINLDGAFRESGGHTVFGQVFKGMDVVDKIAAVETDSSDKPVTDVTIVSARIEKYRK